MAEFLDYGIVMCGGQAYVVTEMDNDSEAYRSGIREGDIIIRIGTNNVRNSNDFKDLINLYL